MRVVVASILAILLLSSVGAAAPTAGRPRVAIIADGPSDLFDARLRLLASEVDALLATDDWHFPTAATAVGAFDRASVEALVREALADRAVDWIVGVGPLVGTVIAEQKSLSKPVFLPVAAPVLQGLPQTNNQSGRKNLVYLTGLLDIDVELSRLAQVGGTEPVMLIGSNLEALIRNLGGADGRVGSRKMKIRMVPAEGSAADILAAIPEDAGAVYIGWLPRLPFAEVDALIAGLNERRLPTYASQGREWVERGAFLTLVPADEHLRRMRQMALYMSDALRGQPLAEMNVIFEPRAELVINMATARAIGVYPRFELLTEAELVGVAEGGRGRELKLQAAVQEALDANLSLRARQLDAEIAEQQLGDAWSEVMPKIDANADYAWLDPDVAFTTPERSLGWGLGAQQVLFSAAAFQGIAAQKHLRRSVDHRIRAVELDIIGNAAIGYLNVLRTHTAERISRENLRRTRRNLALAQVRGEVGVASPAEVYRWEAEIADARARLISASATRNQAEIALNQLMNRPLEEPFAPTDPEDETDGLVFNPRLAQYVDNPWRFKILRSFLVTEAHAISPELRELDELIAAQQRVVAALTQRLFVPELFAAGGFTNTVGRWGKGSDPPPGFPQDDFTWQAGLGLRFNLFDYGRYAQINEREATLSQLRTTRDEVVQRIEQHVRSTLHQAGFTRAAVALRKDAAEATAKNLELVTDAYRQGTVDIITLIDAQNQAFVTEQAAANATYDFLVDFVAAQRAVGMFGFRITEDQRRAFYERLAAFETGFQTDGGSP